MNLTPVRTRMLKAAPCKRVLTFHDFQETRMISTVIPLQIPQKKNRHQTERNKAGFCHLRGNIQGVFNNPAIFAAKALIGCLPIGQGL